MIWLFVLIKINEVKKKRSYHIYLLVKEVENYFGYLYFFRMSHDIYLVSYDGYLLSYEYKIDDQYDLVSNTNCS